MNGKLKKKQAELASMWAGELNFTRVSGDFTFPLSLPEKANVLSAVNRAPEYLRLLDSEQLLQAQARALAADSKSDITVGVGARYNNEFDDVGLIVQASMPLQFAALTSVIKQSRLLHQSILAQQKQVRQQLKSLALSLVHSLQTHQSYLQKINQRLMPYLSNYLKKLNRVTHAERTLCCKC